MTRLRNWHHRTVNSRDFIEARNALCRGLVECQVELASPEEATLWLDDAVEMLGDSYNLRVSDCAALRAFGAAFLSPPKIHNKPTSQIAPGSTIPVESDT